MERNTNIDYILKDGTAVPVSDLNGTTSAVKNFMSNVFSWMFLALGLSAVMAYFFANDPSLGSYINDPVTHRTTGLGLLVMFAPLGFVLIMSFGFRKLAYVPLVLLFLAFAALMGISLSSIFLRYDPASIYLTFGITAATFGVMAVTGYVTHTDLSKFGPILTMGLIGIIIASLVNMFLHSSTFSYLISFLGVAVFTALTAYDVQKLKTFAMNADATVDETKKVSILGALTLYLDFVNLFLFILRFFGRRR